MDILTNVSLFSGAGGLDLGAKLVGGFRTVCYVENEPYAQGILMSRMRDGGLDKAPIWDDVTTFDGKPWAGKVDVISGGFPCQDLSVAGKRAGIKEGKRSSLWFEFSRIIREVGPKYVLVENVPGLIFSGGIGDVLGSLAEAGYDAEWRVVSAADVGAPHLRERVWVVAYPNLKHDKWRSKSRIANSKKWPTRIESERLRGNVAHATSSGAGKNERRIRSVSDRHSEGIQVADTECLSTQRTKQEHGKRRGSLLGGKRTGKNNEIPYPKISKLKREWGSTREWWSKSRCGSWWEIKSGLGGTSDGMAKGVDKNK